MKFKLGAVLSIVGETLMCDIEDVYKILNFMTDDKLFTHQLPRVRKECKPYLLRQFPYLKEYIKDIDPKITHENCYDIINQCENRWGKELEVEKIPKDDHTRKDPYGEMVELRKGDDRNIILL
jgi:hypothetical protein